MKRIIFAVLLFILCVGVGFSEPPTDEKIKQIYDSKPLIIYDMVRKLYILEHAEPQITMDSFVFFEHKTKDGFYMMQLQDLKPMQIQIGTDKVNLLYSIDLKPFITEGTAENNDWIIYLSSIVGGIVLLSGGIWIGLQF